MTIQGVRHDIQEGAHELKHWEYGKHTDGKWYVRVTKPDVPDEIYICGNLGNHEVIEHEDGTITVSPSILITHWKFGQWHGYLEHGIWREV